MCGGTVQVNCGFSGIDDVYTFNFTSGKLERKSPMKQARGHHAIITVCKNVYVFGGRTMGGCLKHCEVYSIQSNTWTRIDDLYHGIDRGFAAIHNGMIYLAGATDGKLQIYDPN